MSGPVYEVRASGLEYLALATRLLQRARLAISFVADRNDSADSLLDKMQQFVESNANDVLPEPARPLGATLVWIPGVIEGWRDGNVRNGAFSAAR